MNNLIRRENRDVARSTGQDRLDPFRVVDALLRWDPFRSDWSGLAQTSDFAPRFDVKETKDAYVIRADMPGVRDDEVEISLSGNLLTVTGKREDEHRAEGDQYYAVERGFGAFARTFSLPDSVDAEHVSAELKNGVLTLRVPKKPDAQPKRIEIGKGGSTDGNAAKA
jgi:HSP20 family protein